MPKSFQSTPSVGRATEAAQTADRYLHISIHALRGEGDDPGEAKPMPYTVISIHALRGEGDAVHGRRKRDRVISIHALRGEGDSARICNGRIALYFNPRPPWGGRLVQLKLVHIKRLISIHALRGEGDRHSVRKAGRFLPDFNPRPPWGGRQGPKSLL